jgi:CheY-like chemotaxis protein
VHSLLAKPNVEGIWDLVIYNLFATVFLGYLEKDRKEKWVLLDTFKKSEKIFRKVYEDIPFSTFVMDRDSRILYANTRGLDLVSNYVKGCNSHNFSKRRVFLNSIIEEDYLKVVNENLATVSESKQTVDFFLTLKVPDERVSTHPECKVDKFNYFRASINSTIWKNSFAYMITLRSYSTKKKSAIMKEKILEGLSNEVESLIKKCESIVAPDNEQSKSKFKMELLSKVNSLKLSVLNSKILFNQIFDNNSSGLKQNMNFHIQKVILNTITTLLPLSKEKGSDLVLKLEQSFPKLVFGDEQLFEQIFFNALSIILDKVSKTKIAIDCNLCQVLPSGKLLLAFEFEFPKTTNVNYEQLLSNLDATKISTLDHYVQGNSLLYAFALIRPGIQIFDGFTEFKENGNSINFTIKLPFKSHDFSEQTNPILLHTFETLNYSSTGKPTSLTYQWNIEEMPRDSQIDLFRRGTPAGSQMASPTLRKISFDDAQKGLRFQEQSKDDYSKNKFMEGLQKLKTEPAKNFGSGAPSPQSNPNSGTPSLTNSILANKKEEAEKQKEEDKKETSILNSLDNTNNLFDKKTEASSPEKVKRSAPKIVLNNTEEFRSNNDTRTEISDTTAYNSLVLYRKYEGDLKIAMAKVLMVILDKYKEKKREQTTKPTHKTTMESISLQTLKDEKGIDEHKLYEKTVLYLSKKLEADEFEEKFPQFIQEYLENLRVEMEGLQESIQLAQAPPNLANFMDYSNKLQNPMNGGSPINLIRRAATTNAKEMFKFFRPPTRKNSFASTLTIDVIDSDRSKERSLNGRLLMSPSMSNMSRSIGLHGKNLTRQSSEQSVASQGVHERKRSGKTPLSKEEKGRIFMTSILPFKQIDLPMQLLARAETIKRKWHSIAANTIDCPSSQNTFSYPDDFTILVVDDSSFIFRGIATLPVKYRTKIEAAKNGSEALMKYVHGVEQGSLYHLILMDLQMPIMDGFETARNIRQEELKKQYPQTYICAMSAFEEADIANKVKREGMNNFCQKPLRVEVLNNLIKQRCEEIGIPLPELS